jgi:hypothetical protein
MHLKECVDAIGKLGDYEYSPVGAVFFKRVNSEGTYGCGGFPIYIGPAPSAPIPPTLTVEPVPGGALEYLTAEQAEYMIESFHPECEACPLQVKIDVRVMHTCDRCGSVIFFNDGVSDHAYTDDGDVYDVCQACGDNTEEGRADVATRQLHRIELPARDVPGMGPMGHWIPVLASTDRPQCHSTLTVSVWVNINDGARVAIATRNFLDKHFRALPASVTLNELVTEANSMPCSDFVAKYARWDVPVLEV